MSYNRSKTRINPCVVTWDEIVEKYHRKYIKRFKSHLYRAIIKFQVLKKTLKAIEID